jgi:hypothetical protein
VIGDGYLVQGPQWRRGNTHYIEAVMVHEGLGLAKQEGGEGGEVGGGRSVKK